jgi:hypothetical protein
MNNDPAVEAWMLSQGFLWSNTGSCWYHPDYESPVANVSQGAAAFFYQACRAREYAAVDSVRAELYSAKDVERALRKELSAKTHPEMVAVIVEDVLAALTATEGGETDE